MLQRLLRRGSLGFCSGTGFFGHGDEALTLAAVHAFAAILRGLALGGPLAGIYPLTLHGGGIRCKRSGADCGSEQHGGGGGHGDARQFLALHFLIPSIVLERSGIAAHVKDPANGVIITQLSELMAVSIRRQRALGALRQGPQMTVY
jgi:hypothetical protein